jgi:predicted ribosome quality control (RQC) complex YloA/Tae2 family protein
MLFFLPERSISMALQRELEKKIDKKNQEIAALEAEIRETETRIREARAFVQGLQEALRSVQKDAGGVTLAIKTNPFRAGSDMAKAEDYLRSTGKPAYITDILQGIGKEVNKTNTKSVAGAMNNYAREGRVFTRTAANTFFLLELQSSDDSETDLPDDFGIDEPDFHEAKPS